MVQLDFTNSSFETCHYELRKKLAVGLRIIVILMGLCVNDELLLCILNVLPFSRRATNLKIQSNYILLIEKIYLIGTSVAPSGGHLV